MPALRSRQATYESRSSPSEDRSRSSRGSKERHDSQRRELTDKRDGVEKAKEIQKILSLHDPNEQVARFLSLLESNLSKESEKRGVEMKVISFALN